MNPVACDMLMHYGTKRHSGRYPWGSGENPYQHSGDFLSRVEDFQEQGFTEKEIAEAVGLSTTDLRLQVKVAKHERRELLRDRARSLSEDGKTPTEIARIMNLPSESSVRTLLNENTAARKNAGRATADVLKKEVEKKGMIDVGKGVERELGCSEGTLKEALFILKTEGYDTYGVGLKQVTNPNQQTNKQVLCKPGIDHAYIYKHPEDVMSVTDYNSVDGGQTYKKWKYPASLDSKRIEVRYAEDGGKDKDGLIEIRRGVKDLSLGNSHYAQVRILVDGKYYLKGMAMYSDDLPNGVDVMFNTNKTKDKTKLEVMKAIDDKDPDNPFGASISAAGQSMYIGKDGKEHLSPINKLKEEGDWDRMSKNLSSQFLSKQPKALIQKQLNLTYINNEEEYNEIKNLTNPTLKKKLLLDFADNCDAAAQHLKAAALPRQNTQVILPMPFLKENEIYAPNYKNGDKVALVRYPHGGTFEIPILTVNNKNQKAQSILPLTSRDAVGIHSKAAEQLSGADFDGDQVIVIPISDRVNIKSSKIPKALQDFDPKIQYSSEGKKNVKLMTQTNKQMGIISNLITDMTLKGAPEEHIIRAVKHSMVVIDAEKHKLDYKQSEKDNGIAELKELYQGRIENGKRIGGASTLMSRRKQDIQVPERKGSPQIDKETGEISYKTTGRTYIDKTGKTVLATTSAKLLVETKDLHTLSSGTPQEELYADYGNKMKALANRARKEAMSTKGTEYSAEAKRKYSAEVESLNAKLNKSDTQAPKERRAQAIATGQINAIKQANPGMSKKDIQKVSQIAIENARATVGKESTKFKVTDKEWKAIQAGAISSSKLESILKYADPDDIRDRATPKTRTQLSSVKVSKIKALASSGYSNAEIAELMGVSSSTVSKYINV